MTTRAGPTESRVLVRPRMHHGGREAARAAIRTTTISILAIGLLASSAVGVAAQDEGPADPMAPSFFAVEYVAGDDFDHVDGTFGEVGPGLEKEYGGATTGLVVEAEDPRAPACGAGSRTEI